MQLLIFFRLMCSQVGGWRGCGPLGQYFSAACGYQGQRGAFLGCASRRGENKRGHYVVLSKKRIKIRLHTRQRIQVFLMDVALNRKVPVLYLM